MKNRYPTFKTRDRYTQGQNGLYYQCYGIGHSLLTLPGTALAYFLSPSSYPHRKGLLMKAWLFHAVFFSAVTVTCYWIIVRVMLSPIIALVLTVLLAAASPIWMFSDYCWNNMSVSMCLTVSITTIILPMIHKNFHIRYWIISGIFLGLAFIIRPFAVTVVPAFLFLVCYHQKFKIELCKSKETFSFLIPVFVCAFFVIAFNLYRFGLPFHFGYSSNNRFCTPWAIGMMGSLFGQAKSPLYFSPAIILAIPAVLLLLFYLRWIAVFTLLFSAPYLILIPKWWAWYGMPDLFQRFWLPLIPIAYLIMAGVLMYIQSKKLKYLTLIAIILFSALGLYHQFLSATTAGAFSIVLKQTNSEIPGGPFNKSPFGYTNPIDLILGRTLVADAQRALLKTNPKSFAILPSVSNPYIRVFAGGIFLFICLFFSILLEKNSNRLDENSFSGNKANQLSKEKE